jgi:hypothetical protein
MLSIVCHAISHICELAKQTDSPDLVVNETIPAAI